MNKARFPLLLVLTLLLLFGTGYNQLVAALERDGHDKGYTAILVVIGTAVTLLFALPLIGTDATLKLLACFAASGTPMTIGSMARYAAQRATEERQLRALAREGGFPDAEA